MALCYENWPKTKRVDSLARINQLRFCHQASEKLQKMSVRSIRLIKSDLKTFTSSHKCRNSLISKIVNLQGSFHTAIHLPCTAIHYGKCEADKNCSV